MKYDSGKNRFKIIFIKSLLRACYIKYERGGIEFFLPCIFEAESEKEAKWEQTQGHVPNKNIFHIKSVWFILQV